MHRGHVPELAAYPVSAGQEQALVLAEDPAFAHDHPHVPVNLAQRCNIVPAGLFGKLAAGGSRVGLTGVQAPTGSGLVPPSRRSVVVAQQQQPVTRVEHDDPASAPQRQPSHIPHPAAGQARTLASAHARHCAGRPRASTQPPPRHGSADSTARVVDGMRTTEQDTRQPDRCTGRDDGLRELVTERAEPRPGNARSPADMYGVSGLALGHSGAPDPGILCPSRIGEVCKPEPAGVADAAVARHVADGA